MITITDNQFDQFVVNYNVYIITRYKKDLSSEFAKENEELKIYQTIFTRKYYTKHRA